MTTVGANRVLIVVALATLGLSANAWAQTNEEIFQQFQWNFSTPGARANAMGQAFIGVADDATAAVTNPAGLMSLTRPQVYLEYKATDLKVNRLAASDSLFSLQTRAFGQTIHSLPFFDIAAPVGSRIAVAFTRHQFLTYEESFQLAPRLIPNHPTNNIFFPVDATSDFSAVTYAGSVAVAVTDFLRVGLTISQNRINAASRSTRSRFSGSGFTAIDTGVIVNESRINDEDSSPGGSFGVLFRPRDQFSMGVVYSRGPSFEVQEDFLFNPSDVVNQPLSRFTGYPKPISIHVPDRLGFGVGVRPLSGLLVSFDAVRVKHSNLAKDFTILLTSLSLTPSMFTVDDATEIHFGGEWAAIAGNRPLFVRAGVFTNPYHGIRFLGIADPALNASNNALYNIGDRDTAVTGTFGGGLAVGPRFQADVAYVWKQDFVVSMAVRF